jgi:tetratricopeptide (TPR) repeat protein
LRLPLINKGQESEGRSYVPRLFRNAPGVYFTGRIHEQVFPSLIPLGKVWGLSTGLATAEILHHGYTKEAVADRNKIERNLALLRKAVDECPEDANLAMNLGLELVRSGDLPGGLPQYRRAFELMSERTPQENAPELREALLTQFTCHLYKCHAYDEVVSVLTSPLAKRAGLTSSLHFALGLAYFGQGQHQPAAEQMRQCIAKRSQHSLTPINTDILTAATHHCLAMSLARLGDYAAAESAFQAGLHEKGREEELRLEYAQFLLGQNRAVDALHRLHEFVSERPQFRGAWRLGAQIALARQEFLEVAGDWTTEAVIRFPEDCEIAAQRAEALLLNRQPAQAREIWRLLWNRQREPRAAAALVLCEILEGRPESGIDISERELGETGRAFIGWYQRFLGVQAQWIISRINEQIEMLRTRLPGAADLLETALEEATVETTTDAEPCLA